MNLPNELSRENMASRIIYAAEDYFYPVYSRLHEELLKRDMVHADEAICQVLREKGRTAEQTSYMWLYTTRNNAPRTNRPLCSGSIDVESNIPENRILPPQ